MERTARKLSAKKNWRITSAKGGGCQWLYPAEKWLSATNEPVGSSILDEPVRLIGK